MRRLIIFGITLVFAVSGIVAAVQAEPSAPSRESSQIESTRPAWAQRAEDSILAIAPPSCDVRQAVDRYVRCLNRYLTRLANGVNDGLQFLDDFFKCTNYVQITQYGDPAQTFGYVFDNNDGTGPFLTSGLDLTEDLATDFFVNVYVVRDTPDCIAFHSRTPQR